MKILQVIDSLPTGGGARFVVNFVLALNKIGIKTDILLLDGTETEFFNELKERFLSYKDKIKLNEKLNKNLESKKITKRIKI